MKIFLRLIPAKPLASNILKLAIPDFTEIRPEVEPSLDDIMQRAFQRDREKRYQTAQNMLTALEMFLYGKGYGPTNEKLASYIKDLFGNNSSSAAKRWALGETPGLEQDKKA